MAEQLKPCPGCGSEARNPQFDNINECFNVYCVDPTCRVCGFGDSKESAAQAWNRRTPPPATKAMLEHLKQHLTDLQQLDPSLDLSNLGNPYLIAVKAFIKEWKRDGE